MVMLSCFVFITIESLLSARLHAQTYRESTSITSFNDLLVECSLPTCVIICDTDDGCNALSINASKSDSLELYCPSSSSCNELNIVDGPSQNLTVSCEGSKSCDTISVHSPNTWRIDITCGFASCTGADFNLESALQVEINCVELSCMYQQFNVDHVRQFSFSGTMQFTEINGNRVLESFTVDCSGECLDVSVYCPMSEDVQCNVFCNGCIDFELYPASFGQLEFQCSSRELACEHVTVYCAEEEASSSTDLRYDRLHGSFVCETERCCPGNMRRNTTTVYCASDECEMTCLNGGCRVKSILDASNASSLLLECSTEAECGHLSVICPEHGVCDIRCTAPYACQYVDISASNASMLSVVCEADYSCQYLQIDAAVVDSADISCSASYSCRDARIEIVGVAMHTNTTLTALRTESFRSSLVNVTNSKNFNVVCTPSNSAYPGTCGYSDFHANNINELSVVCEGNRCAEYMRWNLSANDVSFFCDGDDSCYHMEIYASVQNRFALNSDTSAALKRAELYVSCEDQMSIAGCNQNISVACGGEDETLAAPMNSNNDTCVNCPVDGISASPHQLLFVANSWDIVCPIADMKTTASTMGTIMASLTGTIEGTRSSNTLIAYQEIEIVNTRSTPISLATASNSEVTLPSTATSNAVNGTVIRLFTVFAVLLICIVLVLCGVYRVKANKQQRALIVHQANLSELMHSSSSANVFEGGDEEHLHGYGDGNHNHGHAAQNASLPEVLDEFQPTPGEHAQNYDPNPMEQDRLERWFLSEVNLPQYCQLFVSTGYETLDIIRAINNVSELSEIGVSSPQHQQQILQAVIQLRMAYVANETTNRFGDGERHSSVTSVVEGGRDKYNRSFAVRDHEKRLLVAQEMMEEDDEISSSSISSISCVHKTGGNTQGGLLHDDIDDVKNNVDIKGNGDDDDDVSVNHLEVMQPDLTRLNSDYNVIENSETLGGEEKHVLVHSLRGLENDVDIDQIQVHGVESQGATNTAINMLTLQ